MNEQINVETEEFSNLIFLSGDLDDQIAKHVVLRIIKAEQTSDDPIVIYINSLGGSYDSMTAIYDTMKASGNPITTVCVGSAMSGASLLLAAGDRGKRYIGPNARVMVHEVQAGMMYGGISELNVTAAEANRLNKSLIRLLAKETGRKIKDIKEVLSDNKNTYMSATKAIEFGLADKLYTADEKRN